MLAALPPARLAWRDWLHVDSDWQARRRRTNANDKLNAYKFAVIRKLSEEQLGDGEAR